MATRKSPAKTPRKAAGTAANPKRTAPAAAKKPKEGRPKRKAPRPTGLRLTAGLSAAEVYINRMPGPSGPRPPVPVRASLEITNHTGEPLTFNFRSAQRFDIQVADARGRVITSWGENKRFAAALKAETLAAGKTWAFTGEVLIGDTPDRKLKPGPYEVRIFLTGDRTMSAILPIHIGVAY